MTDKTLQLVYSRPAEGREAEFDEWYNNVHLPEILAVPGIVSAQRFDLFDAEITAQMPRPTHRYLAVYEMEGDVDATMKAIREGVESGAIHMSDSFDAMASLMSFWTPAGPKRTE